MMGRYLSLFLLLLTAVLLQTAVFARYVTLFGITPDLVLVVVISLALIEGPVVGAATGLAGGLFKDLLLISPAGLTGLAYLIVGYAVGRIRPYVQSTSVLIPVIGILVGSAAGSALYLLLSWLLGEVPSPGYRQVESVLLVAIYNTLLVPFVHPVVVKISNTFAPERVYRW